MLLQPHRVGLHVLNTDGERAGGDDGASMQSQETRPCFSGTHLEDANEILLVDAQEMAVVFSEDDGGGSGGVVQQSQLAKVFTLVQGGHQPLCTRAASGQTCTRL